MDEEYAGMGYERLPITCVCSYQWKTFTKTLLSSGPMQSDKSLLKVKRPILRTPSVDRSSQAGLLMIHLLTFHHTRNAVASRRSMRLSYLPVAE